MADGLIRVPPDSTGKRVRHVERTDVAITNIVANVLSGLQVGDVITGATSGVTANYTGQKADNVDRLLFLKNVSGTFTVGEDLEVSGTKIAEVESSTQLYAPSVSLTDGDSPFNRLHVSSDGEARVEFLNGTFNFSAFGDAVTTGINKIDEITFLYTAQEDRFYNDYATGGTGSIEPSGSTYVLSVNTTSGSRASKTTHRYYSYEPGTGNQMLMTCMIGDSGKAGVVRRWGQYDDNDGLFFELSGSVFSVVQRSSTSGTVVDTKVEQTSFNGEPLNDPVESSFVLDISKFNIYWLDYQWLGAGRVRFGVYGPDGIKRVLHTFENANSDVSLYTKRGTFPIRWEQFNETSTASTSEFRVGCIAIQRQGNEITYPGEAFTYLSGDVAPKAVSGSEYVPLFSVRPKLTLNGQENRITIIPEDFEFVVDGDPIIVNIYQNAILTGSSFGVSASVASSADLDVSATSFTNGVRKESIFVQSGVTTREIIQDAGVRNALHLSANNLQPILTIAAKTANPSGSANVTTLVRWKEAK